MKKSMALFHIKVFLVIKENFNINLNVGVAEVPKDGELHCTKLLAYVHNIVTVTAEEN